MQKAKIFNAIEYAKKILFPSDIVSAKIIKVVITYYSSTIVCYVQFSNNNHKLYVLIIYHSIKFIIIINFNL